MEDLNDGQYACGRLLMGKYIEEPHFILTNQ